MPVNFDELTFRRAIFAAALFSLSILGTAMAATGTPASHELHSDWRFAKGEQPGAEAAGFDDSKWSMVRVPHDWAIAGPFDPKEDGHAAKLPWRGVGWYRRSFTLDCQQGQQVYLDFDGVMAFPKVYINGKLAGEWDYGYTSFRIDATPFVNFHGNNEIAVRVDTTKHGTRWYPGAGIYRKVTLEIRNPIHISHWGTVVTTPMLGEKAAEIKARTTVENHTTKDAKVAAYFTIRGPDGKEHVGFGKRCTVPASGSAEVVASSSLVDYQRWDIDQPALYTIEAEVVPESAFDRKEVDHSQDYDKETATFGIRQFGFTADDGFHLNGRRVQLHGVCLHHDQGPLGGAFYARAMERQLEIMRDMGVNAIRTSHNPPAPELLELCDRMGFVVWDECFDKWDDKADRVDGVPPLKEHAERHLRSMVTRDRNHPSVVVWSIANEISAVGGKNGLTKDRIAMMRDIVRTYDDTRPVGLAHHIPPTAETDIFEPLDLTGWNYARRYATFRKHYPNKPIIYSESASALSTRGFYALPLPKAKTEYADGQHQVDSYDFNSAKWSDIPDLEFKLMHDDSFVAGEFVWTGFDYLGEPTPYNRDAVSSYFGIVDLCGIPKDRFYLYRSYWRPETPTVHILPHWNWPDRVGKKVPVFVYTNGDSAELFLDGKSLGMRKKGDVSNKSEGAATAPNGKSYYDPINLYRLRWDDVVYEPGELKAVAYKNGKEIGSEVVRTAGEPIAVRLKPDRSKVNATGDDLCYVLVEAVDRDGVVCPLAENAIRFSVSGPGEIVAVGNGNPMSLESFQANERNLFFGKAMLIVRTVEGKTGAIEVTATSANLKEATATIEAMQSASER
jgi:beta-galactosidase